MFRNPRENAWAAIETPLKPSTGRPPTPPTQAPREHLATMASTGSSKPLTPRPNSKTNVPLSTRQSVNKTTVVKINGKTNASILNFFKKVDSPLKDESIFLSQRSTDKDIPTRAGIASPRAVDIEVDIDVDLEDIYGPADLDTKRFNELGGSIKKRKTSIGSMSSVTSNDEKSMAAKSTRPPNVQASLPSEPTKKAKPKKSKPKGPFLADSDSEDEL